MTACLGILSCALARQLNDCSFAYCPTLFPLLQLRQQPTQPDCFDKNEGATGNKSRRKAVFVRLG